ncbi:hypothetical protein GEMRC1_013983 [Eukaryota sp. GEM-RC1]
MNPNRSGKLSDSTSDTNQLDWPSKCNRSSSSPGDFPQPESHTFVPAADTETRPGGLLSKNLEEPMSRLSLIPSNELSSSVPSKSAHPIHLQGSLHVSILEHLSGRFLDFAREYVFFSLTSHHFVVSETLRFFLTNVGFVSHRFYEYALFAFKTFLATKTLRVKLDSDDSWDVLSDLLAVTTFLDTQVGSIELDLRTHDDDFFSHFSHAFTSLSSFCWPDCSFDFLIPSNSCFLDRLRRLCVWLSVESNQINLWEALQQNNTVEELEVTFIDRLDLSEFITFIRDNQTIRILKLYYNGHNWNNYDAPLMKDLCKVLNQSTVLKEICLEVPVVSNEYLNLLSSRPYFNSALCPLSNSNMTQLICCKKDLDQVREIVFPLSHKVKDEDVIAFFESNPFITSAVFPTDSLSTTVLSYLMKNTSISMLDLYNCQDWDCFFEYVKTTKSLRYLKIWALDAYMGLSEKFWESLTCNSSLRRVTIGMIDFESLMEIFNFVGKDQLNCIIDVSDFVYDCSTGFIRCAENLEDRDLLLILTTLRSNTRLTRVEFQGLQFDGITSVIYLYEIFSLNDSLLVDLTGSDLLSGNDYLIDLNKGLIRYDDVDDNSFNGNFLTS